MNTIIERHCITIGLIVIAAVMYCRVMGVL